MATKRFNIIFFSFLIVLTTAASGQTLIRSYQKTDQPGVIYNLLKVDDKFILLKDSTANLDLLLSNVKLYLQKWKNSNQATEADNIFMLNTKFKSTSDPDTANFDVKKSNRKYELKFNEINSNLKINNTLFGSSTIDFREVLFTCTSPTNVDHKGPHTNADKEKLKNDFGCTNFKPVY